MAKSARARSQLNATNRPNRSGGDWWFTSCITIVALLARAYAAIAWAREPVWDGHYYHFGATRIAEGLGYSEDVLIDGVTTWKPWCHYPVGYSGFLGMLYKVFGNGLLVAPLANAVVGALCVLVVHRLARTFLPTGRSRVAALICALHPGLILYTSLVMTEGLAAFSMALGGLLALLFRDSKRGAVLGGLVLGLGALVRPTTLLAIPLLALVFRGTWRRTWLRTALAGAVALATVCPWTLRNCRVMDGCTLISTNGGWNLAIGALTQTGRFTTLKASYGCPGPGQVKQDRCWREIGLRKILEDPGHWLGLIPKKLSHTYNHESFATAYLAEANPEFWTEQRKQATRNVITAFHHLLMFAATLAAVARPPWRWPLRSEAWLQLGLLGAIAGFAWWALGNAETPLFWLIVLAPLLAALRLPGAPPLAATGSFAMGLIFMTSVTHAVFFGDDRYHMTISPILCLLAAAALRPGGHWSFRCLPADPLP
jgi:hypothetical protein